MCVFSSDIFGMNFLLTLFHCTQGKNMHGFYHLKRETLYVALFLYMELFHYLLLLFQKPVFSCGIVLPSFWFSFLGKRNNRHYQTTINRRKCVKCEYSNHNYSFHLSSGRWNIRSSALANVSS